MILFVFNPATAGPPLATGDTGIVDPGQWEFILGVAGASRPAVDSSELPLLDVTFGIRDSLQAGFVLPRQVVEERGESAQSGWGEAEISFAWRFYENDGKALVLAPAYAFPLTSSSRIRGLVEDVRVLSLPVIGSVERGKWVVTGQVGFDWTSVSVNGLGYGAWVGYSVTDAVQLLAEVYGEELSGDEFDEGVINWRLGVDWAINDQFNLLLGYGGDISSDLPSEDKLDYDYFVGLQYATN